MSPSRMAEIDEIVAGKSAPAMDGHVSYIPLHMDMGVGSLLMWFLLLTIAMYVLLFNIPPAMVMVVEGNSSVIDYQKVLMYSVIFALVAMVALYFLCRM